MSKVLLIDVDSRIPNLALMKLSAYHKSIGDEVGFNTTDPDKIYASVIFKRNRHKVDGLRFFYSDAEINIGGTGYSLDSRIPVPETPEGGGGQTSLSPITHCTTWTMISDSRQEDASATATSA